MSRDVIFGKLSMLHSKLDEDLGKVKDDSKQVEFERSTSRKIGGLEEFESLNGID